MVNIDRSGPYYLASPYYHPDSMIRYHRFCLAKDAVLDLLNEGITAISPIAYYHPLAVTAGLPLDATFWWQHNHRLMSYSKGLILLTIDGWEKSEGVRLEIDYFRGTNSPCYKMEPNYAPQLSTLD